MRKFLVQFHVMLNGKKIHAIRDVRRATGMGLADSKTFCETPIPDYVDSYGGNLICNGEQVARLLELDIDSRGQPSLEAFSIPGYAVKSCSEITITGLDISNNELV